MVTLLLPPKQMTLPMIRKTIQSIRRGRSPMIRRTRLKVKMIRRTRLKVTATSITARKIEHPVVVTNAIVIMIEDGIVDTNPRLLAIGEDHRHRYHLAAGLHRRAMGRHPLVRDLGEEDLLLVTTVDADRLH
jgi:hypothetical protein